MTDYREEPRRSGRTRKATAFYTPTTTKTTTTTTTIGAKRKAADSLDGDDTESPLSSLPSSPTITTTTRPDAVGSAGRPKDAKVDGNNNNNAAAATTTSRGPAKKKLKITEDLRAEAYQEVHGSVARDDLPLAMGAYLVARNNRAAAWTKLEAQEAQVAVLLKRKTVGDFAAVRRKAFNTLMDGRVKAAKHTFNKLRFARRAEYDRGAVEEARRQLDLARAVRALGPDWKPDPELERERGPDDGDD